MLGEKVSLDLSERVKVDVAEMDGMELGKADIIVADIMAPSFKAAGGKKAKSPNMMAGLLILNRVYAVASIRSINGTEVEPLRHVNAYNEVARQLGAREIQKLVDWAKPVYSDESEDEDGEDEEESES